MSDPTPGGYPSRGPDVLSATINPDECLAPASWNFKAVSLPIRFYYIQSRTGEILRRGITTLMRQMKDRFVENDLLFASWFTVVHSLFAVGFLACTSCSTMHGLVLLVVGFHNSLYRVEKKVCPI
ncbi:hypothetical protein K0M31_009136 [Melipona bicolor]|uniref:Uncharacterized protein n=1 Tax=Melipona bicolor TaxID=60889 RepID=A0AA40KJK3_9HYME|nr:hypothetical protein K0M31_009136 [Melipona bicolor]